MCNIYKNNLNILLNLGENDIIYYDDNNLHIEDRYLCSLRGQKNPIKILDIFITSYNNYYNHYIISTEDKYSDSDNITELDVDISYFKNCIKGIRIYVNNISNNYTNLDINYVINKIDDLEKNTIENYLIEKENCKKLVDSISDKNNYGLFTYFFHNKNDIEGKIINEELNIKQDNKDNKNNNLNNDIDDIIVGDNYLDDDNIENNDDVFEEQSSYYQEEKQSNYQYFEGLLYIIGRKLSNLLLGISNHISHIFFFKNY